jgi:transposase InsO family protein
MLIHLHKQATTTPKVRAAIQASGEPASALAARFGTTEQTVYKWKHRDSVHDRSHTPHRLQTTLTPAQEAVAVALRTTLLVSLDDLLAVVREFLNPNASRSGLDRCLRRHGVGNLRDLKAKAPTPKHSAFKAYEPGYIHIDVKYLPQMADEASRRYLFVAIDRATRWVFIRVFKAKTAANARRFLRDLERACPLRIRTILTDNGKEFTDRLFGLRKRAATGEHEFGKLCAALDIEHRLTPPKSPQTNGMVERFNGRIEEVLQSHHFRSGEELETTLHRYVWLYNQQLPQSALGSKTPLQAMKDWHKLKPELFKKQPYYLTGCDTYTNAAQSGFFWRAHTAHNIASRQIMVECKNYSKDPANPEIDQLSGRFGANRGKLGMMLYRTVEDYDRLCTRCRDTAQDDRGFMLPLGDEQVLEYLNLIAADRRADIDARLQAILIRLID